MPVAAKSGTKRLRREALETPTGRLLGGVLQRAKECKQARLDRQDVLVDVEGNQISTTREELWALGASSLFTAELDDFDADVVVLSCQEAAFEALHGAMSTAVADLRGGVLAVRRNLGAGPDGAALRELLESLGLQWLLGTPLPAPAAVTKGETVQIARLKAQTRMGALRHLADKGGLPTGGEGFGQLSSPAPGAVRVARETRWAESWTHEDVVVQVLDLPSEPWSRSAQGVGPVGCYQPNIVCDGDRLVLDVGVGRFMHVHRLVLGLSSMEGKDEQVTVELEAASSASSGRSNRFEGSGKVKHREHTYSQQAATPPQTCTVLAVDARGADSPLMDRALVATFRVPGGGTLALYHVELFGVLLETPAELSARVPEEEAFAFGRRDRNEDLPRRRCEGRFYLEEMQFLRSLGLLDTELELELQGTEFEGARNVEAWDDLGIGDED